ncbi:MAG: hypothetical protein WB239_16620, partial [Acidimicrobiia bacterium]
MGLLSSIRRLKVATLAIALIAGLVAGAVPARATVSEAPTLLGFATGKDWRTDLPDFAKEAGKYPAFHEVFRTIDSDWTANWLPAFYQDPHDWDMVSWLVTYVNDLDGFNQGRYDPDLKAMVGFFKSWMSDDPTKRLVLAPFPEANLAGHPWAGDPAGYKAAFKRIHDAFRNAGLGPKRVRFAFVMNGISSSGLSYDQFYPGDTLVDILSFNKHNRNVKLSSDPAWRDYEATFGMHIEEMQRLISRTKPIFINQTGSVEDPDDPNRREQWIDDMFAGLKANDQVIGAAYLDRIKQESTGTYDFRVLVDGILDAHFAAGYATWSSPDATAWIFDGRMDDWVANRAATLDTGFLDVPSNHVFADAIRWLGDSGITQGCNPPANDLFCPDYPLTRGQMAAMLARG